MRLVLCLVFALMALVARAQLPPVQWSVYKSGETSRLKQARTAAFQTEGQFIEFWRELTGENASFRDVDWSKEFLVAVCLGERASAGFRVQVDSVERERGGQIKVTYAESTPQGMNAQVITSPFEVVRVQRGGGAVVFEKITRRGQGSGGGFTGPNCSWRTYMADTIGGGQKSVERVINDSRSWGAYWLAFLKQNPPRDLPDFDNETMIAIHVGRFDTAGYDVLIDSVESNGIELVVRYVVKAPSRDQVKRRTNLEPYVIIRVPKHTGTVRFQSRTWTSDGR